MLLYLKLQIGKCKFYFSNLHFAIISHVLWKIGWRQGKKNNLCLLVSIRGSAMTILSTTIFTTSKQDLKNDD